MKVIIDILFQYLTSPLFVGALSSSEFRMSPTVSHDAGSLQKQKNVTDLDSKETDSNVPQDLVNEQHAFKTVSERVGMFSGSVHLAIPTGLRSVVWYRHTVSL